MEPLLHMMMAAQRLLSVMRGAEHAASLMRQSAHRRSRRNGPSARGLLGDAVYGAPGDRRDGAQ
jgi:hypothetical protein